jgi:nitroreductase
MLENLVDAQYTVDDLIRGRWSRRAFSNRTVEQDKLLILLEATRWGASSYNEQPWSFIE